MVIFLYNLYIFIWIQYGCLAYTVFTLDPISRVLKGLWCTLKVLTSMWICGLMWSCIIHVYPEASCCMTEIKTVKFIIVKLKRQNLKRFHVKFMS